LALVSLAQRLAFMVTILSMVMVSFKHIQRTTAAYPAGGSKAFGDRETSRWREVSLRRDAQRQQPDAELVDPRGTPVDRATPAEADGTAKGELLPIWQVPPSRAQAKGERQM
jgi:hypothetical protein